MGITFNADEIFAMAEEIERNGQKFYRKAAQNIVNDDIAQMLRSLADMEMDHEKTFADMRKLLRGRELEQNVFDPDNKIALYLQAMADGHVFDLSCEPAEQLIGNESIEDILKMAIAAEKDSIIFYVGLKDSVPENAGKDKINNIIKEEMNHIAVLNQFMTALK